MAGVFSFLVPFAVLASTANTAHSSRQPETAPALAARGDAWAKLERWHDAIRDYEAAVRQDPTFTHAIRCRAMAWRAIGNKEKALADLNEAIRLDPTHARTVGTRGVLLTEMGEFEKALTDMNEAIRLDPKDDRSYQSRATLLVIRGDIRGAIKDANEAVRLAPTAAVHALRAGVWVGAGDVTKAVEDWDRAIQLSPKDATLFVGRATCWSLSKQWDMALKDLNEAIRLDPGNVTARSNRAWLQATCPTAELRDGRQAIEDATQACRASGWRDGNHLTALAAAYAEAGDFTKAVEFQKRAMSYPKSDPTWTDRARKRLQLYVEQKPYRTDK
jgi:tetratricopeptide (TPR) repeat protein